MIRITLVTVGKVKEKYFRDAIQEYSKRLGSYCRLDILEVADEKTPEGASPAEEEKIKELEGRRILAKIPQGSFVITLEIGGKLMDSVSMSRFIQQKTIQGCSHLTLIIGGSLGLSREVCQKSDLALSFGPMTFPHQLMRVMLLEQIYRAFRIQSGEPYHK